MIIITLSKYEQMEVVGLLHDDVMGMQNNPQLTAMAFFSMENLYRILKRNYMKPILNQNKTNFKFKCTKGEAWFLWSVYGKRTEVECGGMSRLLSGLHKYII